MGQVNGNKRGDAPRSKNGIRGKSGALENHGPSQKWLSLLDVIPTILISINTNYKILDFSRLMRGRQSMSSIGQSMFDFIAKEYCEQVKKVIDESIATGQVRQYRTLGIGPAGPDTAWYHTVVVPEKIKGKVESLTLVCTDITSEVKTEKTLRETMSYLQIMLNATTATFFLADGEGRILFANAVAAKKLNKTPDELVGLTAQEVISGLQPEQIWALRSHYVREVFDTGRAVEFEDERNGKIFRNCIYPVSDAGGKPYLMVYYAEDVTESRKAERAAKESEERFRELADFLPQSIFELDTMGRIIYANKQAFESWGYSEEDLKKGVYAVDMFIPEDREKLINRQKRLLVGQKLEGMEYRGKRKDGSIYHVVVYSSPIKKDGEVVGIRGISIDITDRKKIERELMLAEEKYRLIVDNVKSSIAIFDEAGVIQYANKIAAASLDRGVHLIKGKSMWELFPMEVADNQMKTIREVIRGGKDISKITRTRPAGEWRWYHTIIQPIKPSRDLPVQAMIIATDITDERENEIRNVARLKLLDRVRDAEKVEDVIAFGCQAIKEFGLYEKAAFFSLDESGRLASQGKYGFKANEYKKLSALLSELPRKMNPPQVKKSRLLMLYKDENGPAYSIGTEDQGDIQGMKWSEGEFGLFFPRAGDGENRQFGVVFADPCEGRKPSIRDVEYLQEIFEIIAKDLRRIDGILLLREERQNLHDANVALSRVLEHIEKEKKEIRQQLAHQIDQNVMPAFHKMIRSDGSINMDFYELLKSELNNLVLSSGNISQLLSRLTPRELEICNLIKIGKSNAEISKNLYISVGTVKKHRELIRKKLGLANKGINLTTFLRGNRDV